MFCALARTNVTCPKASTMRRLSLAPILMLVLGACSEPDTSDIFSVQGVVVGQVLTTSHATIPDALVIGAAQYPVAGGSIRVADGSITDAAGAFRLVFTVVNMPDTVAPLALHVAASGASLDTTGLQVRMRRTISGSDTTRVVLTLMP